MANPLDVLIVEDSESDAQLVVRLLDKAGYKVAYKQVDTAGGMQAALERQTWDIVISDYSLPQFDGAAALALLKQTGQDIPFIVVSGTMGEETAVAMMKAGAQDYLVKGNLKRLIPAIERELEQARVRRERKQAREDMLASEERYRLIFDTSLDGILLLSQEGGILAANTSACRIFNRTEDEITYISLSEIVESAELRFHQALEEISQKGHFFDELTLIRKDGTRIPGEVTAALFKDRDGRQITSMIVRDITWRKRKEQQLAESESRYKGLFEDSPISLWEEDFSAVKERLDVLRKAGIKDFGEYFATHPEAAAECAALIKVLDINQATLGMLGATRKEEILGNLTKIFEAGSSQVFRHELSVMAAGKTRFDWEGTTQTLDGRSIDIELKWYVAPGFDESFSRVIVSVIDITERKQAEGALRESESIFRGFLEESVDAIMLTDEQGVVIQWSKGAEKLTGYSRDESIGKPLWDVQYRSAPDAYKTAKQYELIKSSLQVVLSAGQGGFLDQLLEAEIQRPDGTRVAAQTLAFSIHTQKGNLLGSILRDITERKQAEEAIRLSEERYRTLYENNNIGLYRTQPDGTILLANPSLVKMLGFRSFDELKNKNLEQDWFQPSFPRSKFIEMIESQGQVQGLESTWERQDGSFIFIRENARAIRAADGKTLYYDGTVEDITERKQAEDKLQLSEKRFFGAFEYAAIGMALVATDGLLLRVNRALCNLLGYSQDELLKKTFQDITYAEDLEADLNNVNRLLAGTLQSYQMEKRYYHSSGEIVWTLLNVSLIRDDRGAPLYFISQIENITERKQAEEALRTSETRYRGLFEDSPISLWEEDYSAVKERLDSLRSAGVTDFGEYFTSHPDAVQECSALIKILDVNKATMKLFGANRKEDMLKNLAEIFEGQPPQAFRDELIIIAAGNTRLEWQGINKTLDGRLIDVEMNWSVAPGYENSLSKVIVSLVDITERKQAEAALARSEEEYRTLFENMPIGLYRTSADGRILEVNQAMVNMFGYTDREAMLAENVVELYVDPGSDLKFKNEIEKTGIVTNFEAEFSRPDGTTFWTEDHNHIIRDEEGSPLFYEGSLIDITERRQAEEKLVEERKLLRTLIDHLPDLVYVKDTQGRKTLSNLADVAASGGKTMEDVIGKTDFDTYPPEMAEEYWALDKAALDSGIPITDQEERGLDADGNPIWLLSTKVPLLDANGTVVGLVGIGHDITERKQVEAALHESRRRYRALFEDTPVAIWEQDFSALKSLLDSLKQQGYADLRLYFKDHPQEVTECATLIQYLDVNKAALKLYRANSKEDLFKNTSKSLSQAEQEHILEDFIAIAEGRTANHWEGPDETLLGDPLEISLNWSVAPGYELDFSRVIVTTIDITERKYAEDRIQRQLRRLAALRAIDQVVTSSFDLRNSLSVILNHVTGELGVNAADVLTFNPVSMQLDYAGGVGFRTQAAERAGEHLGNSLAGRVALERQLIQVSDLKGSPPVHRLRTQLAGEDFTSYFGVPLMAKGSIKGVLEVFHRSRLEPDQEWIDFLNTVAGQAALAIDNTNLFDSLQRSNIDLTLAYDATIEGWSHAMDLRDKETEGHTLRVTEMTMELAGLFGIEDEDMVGVRRGALLHDIGKMGVPDAILLKPAALTEDEWVIMKSHPALAFEMLSPIRYLQSAIDIPYCHHEKWDGTGYPRGLKGDQIPLAARIFAIADVWDAVTSDRPYRKAWSHEKALDYLKSEAGKQFDPQVIKICLDAGVLDRKKRG